MLGAMRTEQPPHARVAGAVGAVGVGDVVTGRQVAPDQVLVDEEAAA